RDKDRAERLSCRVGVEWKATKHARPHHDVSFEEHVRSRWVVKVARIKNRIALNLPVGERRNLRRRRWPPIGLSPRDAGAEQNYCRRHAGNSLSHVSLRSIAVNGRASGTRARRHEYN